MTTTGNPKIYLLPNLMTAGNRFWFLRLWQRRSNP